MVVEERVNWRLGALFLCIQADPLTDAHAVLQLQLAWTTYSPWCHSCHRSLLFLAFAFFMHLPCLFVFYSHIINCC